MEHLFVICSHKYSAHHSELPVICPHPCIRHASPAHPVTSPLCWGFLWPTVGDKQNWRASSLARALSGSSPQVMAERWWWRDASYLSSSWGLREFCCVPQGPGGWSLIATMEICSLKPLAFVDSFPFLDSHPRNLLMFCEFTGDEHCDMMPFITNWLQSHISGDSMSEPHSYWVLSKMHVLQSKVKTCKVIFVANSDGSQDLPILVANKC